MPVLGNLYCVPNDVFDLLGTTGGQLRLDDDNLATGQTITATVDAAQAATSITIQPLQRPLLRGSVLEFAGSGMPQTLEVTLSVVATVGSTTLTVNPLSSQVNALATARDNGVNLATAIRLAKSCQWGTNQVRLYCQSRYDDSQLYINAQQQGSCNRWATALAARNFCERRAMSCPKGINRQADEAVEEMRQVRVSMLSIENIGTRTSGWPFITNVTLDQFNYQYAKLRVEQPLSEGTPTQYPQWTDWSSALYLEW